MNTTATRWTHTVMIAAALAACFIAQHAVAAPANSGKVVMLPRVVVTGHRVQPVVVQLPRVVVTGHRTDAADSAQAKREEASPKRVTTLVAMR